MQLSGMQHDVNDGVVNAESGLTLPCGASARASGMSSAKTIQVMQPAAKPKARGSKEVKVSTNMKEGTASRGWGRAVARAHQAAFLAGTPLDTNTVATASPSGMLCRPIASVTRMPCTHKPCSW